MKYGVKNPCVGCEFYGLCDHDDCGAKLYAIFEENACIIIPLSPVTN